MTHGMDVHGTPEETKNIQCSSSREGAEYRQCRFTEETCPYRDHAGAREAGSSATDSAMGGAE